MVKKLLNTKVWCPLKNIYVVIVLNDKTS